MVSTDLLPYKSAGNKASIRSSSMVPIRVPTPGKVLLRYCHSIWSDIPKPAYAYWGYHLDILDRVRTSWAHASNLVLTQSSSSPLGPQ